MSSKRNKLCKSIDWWYWHFSQSVDLLSVIFPPFSLLWRMRMRHACLCLFCLLFPIFFNGTQHYTFFEFEGITFVCEKIILFPFHPGSFCFSEFLWAKIGAIGLKMCKKASSIPHCPKIGYSYESKPIELATAHQRDHHRSLVYFFDKKLN